MDDPPETDGPWTMDDGCYRPSSMVHRLSSIVTALALATLTVLALALRLHGLDAPDGRLDTDEARLVLAAEGILERGIPVMPSGRVYTRGLTNAYLMAPFLSMLGTHDFSARLPSALAGALLVPLVFVFGRTLGGAGVGLLAATAVALLGPLVDWSRSAWLPSDFLLLLTLAAYLAYLGLARGSARALPAAAAAFLLALLSSEFALLLPPACALCALGLWLRGERRFCHNRAGLLGLALVAGGLLAFVGLALALRVGTVAGPGSEIAHYFTPGLGLGPPRFYFERLLADNWPLLLAALAGLPLAWRRDQGGALLLGSLLGLAFLVPSFVIQGKREAHYALATLPALALLGAWGAWLLAGWLFPGRRLAALLALGLVGAALVDDTASGLRHLASPPPGPTWLQALERLGRGPDDLVLGEAPTILRLYLGRDDYYVHPEGYERYTEAAPDAIRNIYSGGILLRRQGDFEALVEPGKAGRTLWVIGREERLSRLAAQVDAALWRRLLQQADLRQTTRDRWLILRVRLPVR